MATHSHDKRGTATRTKRAYTRRAPVKVTVDPNIVLTTEQLRAQMVAQREAIRVAQDEFEAKRTDAEAALEALQESLAHREQAEQLAKLPDLTQNLLDTVLSAKEQLEIIISLRPELANIQALKPMPFSLTTVFPTVVNKVEALVVLVSKPERSEGEKQEASV